MRVAPLLLLCLAGITLTACGGDGVNPLNAQPGANRTGSGARPVTETMAARAIASTLATEAVPNDADDPAIWVNPKDPSKSLIIGTDKIEDKGGLYVFNLAGKIVQTITPIDRPNNVDVVTGFTLGREQVDLVVATERKKSRLLIYRIDPATGKLSDVTGNTKLFTERTGLQAEVMGVAMYKRPKDGAIFAIVSPKNGPREGYLGQFRLVAKDGKIDVVSVRRFGAFSGLTPTEEGEIEAITVDSEHGFVYYSDELKGIRKYLADPDAKDANKEIAIFGETGYMGDREGLAVYRKGKGGFLVSTDQIELASELHIYDRGDTRTKANRLLAVLKTPSDTTDGIEVTEKNLGPNFPNGILVMMNSKDKNFLIFDWRRIEQALAIPATPTPPRR